MAQSACVSQICLLLKARAKAFLASEGSLTVLVAGRSGGLTEASEVDSSVAILSQFTRRGPGALRMSSEASAAIAFTAQSIARYRLCHLDHCMRQDRHCTGSVQDMHKSSRVNGNGLLVARCSKVRRSSVIGQAWAATSPHCIQRKGVSACQPKEVDVSTKDTAA